MVDRTNGEVTFTVHEILGVLSERADGWKYEVTLTSWNGSEPKIDIRCWDPDHERMSRGITMFEDDAQKLARILSERYGGKA